MSSVASAECKRALVAIAVGCAVTSLLWLPTSVTSQSLWAYLLRIPAYLLACLLGPNGPHAYWLGTIINLIIYSGGIYLVLWSRQKRRRRSRTQGRVGFIDEILSQERAPIFTGASVFVSLVIFGLMLITFARWHENLGFGTLAVLPLYATVAFISVATNVVFGCVATARGESYAARVAVVSASICVLAAFTFAHLTC